MSKPSSSMSPADPRTSVNDSTRIRSSRACLHCSRRKVKCDGLQPCNNCAKDSIACEYGAQKKRGPPKGCDPRGGRKKKVPDPSSQNATPPSATPVKRKASQSSKADPAARDSIEVHIFGSNDPPHVAKKSQKNTKSSDTGSSNDLSETAAFMNISPKRDVHPDDRAVASSSHSTIASLTARPSPDTRFASQDRSTLSSHASSSSHVMYDAPPSWSRPSYSQPTASSSSLTRRSSHLSDSAPGALSTFSHPSQASNHTSQHASTPLAQHYLQPQHPQHYHSDHHQSDHSWLSSSTDSRFSHQNSAPSSHGYDAYPLQGSLRDYHRSSPLASHRSMLPPYSSSQHSADHASHPAAERAAAHLLSGRNQSAIPVSTLASPRSHASRSLYENQSGHYDSGTSPYDRTSALSSSSSLSNRHPVSASRLTEASGSSQSAVAPAAAATSAASAATAASSSSLSTGVNPSPAFTGASHGYSPSSTAMPHRPWYNGSQPPSPRGPGSIPRSQISSPGAHWLDYHVRPSSAAANHAYSSSKIHLEDRLPPHILQRLLDIYQVFVHPHWPIIYLPSVTSLHSLKRSRPIVFEAILAVASNTFDAYLDAASDDEQQSANPVLEMLLAESPQGPEQPSLKSNELRDHFVYRVKTRIFEGKFAQDIGTIQAAILISVIELGCGNTSSAFQFGGIACRMALDMNLHRCTAQSSFSASAASHEDSSRQEHASAQHTGGKSKAEPHRSSAQLQERMRVFWACFILDKILSTALDKPAQLRSAEIETDWPSVQEADEYDLWINETTRKFVDKSQLTRLEGVKVHALSSFKAWAEVMAILERILEEVYSPQAKRDRRRTKGASDYDAMLRLNDRLSQWRSDLPPHLKWSGTWTSPELLSSVSSRIGSADRRESDAHRGLPPQILTMRSWYCICLILLHRPRVPKLLEGPKERGPTSSEEPQLTTAETAAAPASTKGKKNGVQSTKKGGQTMVQDRSLEPAGLDICNAAAKEVCDILHVYGSSFRIRKISSSWVYLIFQSATIHAALAASKSVVAFKARQSSIWSRRGSKLASSDFLPSAADRPHDVDAAVADEADLHAGAAEAESHHVTEAELEGSSELVKTSALYLAECVRYLKRIGPTWQSASNHVAVLRNLCIASAQARPHSPTAPSTAAAQFSASGHDPRFTVPNVASTTVKREDNAIDVHAHQLLSTVGVPGHEPHSHQNESMKALQHAGSIVPGQEGSTSTYHPFQHDAQHDAYPHQDHPDKSDIVSTGGATADLGIGSSSSLQSHFLHPQSNPPAHPHQHVLSDSGVPVHHQQMQQALYPINANDSAFWASMPVASEGYNEWDEFFKAFNPSAGSDVASQHPNYHPTAAVDLITALQDPNRLLSGFHQQHH